MLEVAVTYWNERQRKTLTAEDHAVYVAPGCSTERLDVVAGSDQAVLPFVMQRSP